MSRTVLLCGSDAVFSRMLAYELSRAGYVVAGEGDIADCVLVDLDSVSTTALPELPAIGYSRLGVAAAGMVVLRRPFAIPTLLDALAHLALPGEEGAADLLRLDDASRTVSGRGARLTLMPGEYALLRALVEADGEAVSREALIAVLPAGSAPNSNLIEVLVCALRRRLEETFGLRPIRTVRGVGYRYVCERNVKTT